MIKEVVGQQELRRLQQEVERLNKRYEKARAQHQEAQQALRKVLRRLLGKVAHEISSRTLDAYQVRALVADEKAGQAADRTAEALNSLADCFKNLDAGVRDLIGTEVLALSARVPKDDGWQGAVLRLGYDRLREVIDVIRKQRSSLASQLRTKRLQMELHRALYRKVQRTCRFLRRRRQGLQEQVKAAKQALRGAAMKTALTKVSSLPAGSNKDLPREIRRMQRRYERLRSCLQELSGRRQGLGASSDRQPQKVAKLQITSDEVLSRETRAIRIRYDRLLAKRQQREELLEKRRIRRVRRKSPQELATGQRDSLTMKWLAARVGAISLKLDCLMVEFLRASRARSVHVHNRLAGLNHWPQRLEADIRATSKQRAAIEDRQKALRLEISQLRARRQETDQALRAPGRPLPQYGSRRLRHRSRRRRRALAIGAAALGLLLLAVAIWRVIGKT